MSLKVYWEYFRSGGGFCSIFWMSLTCLFTQFLFSGSDYWLTLWTNAEEFRARTAGNFSLNASSLVPENDANNATDVVEERGIFTGDWWREPDTYTGVYVFTILIICVFIFSMIRTIHYFLMCMISSINLHNRMFQCVIRAPLLFFDQNPVGNNQL